MLLFSILFLYDERCKDVNTKKEEIYVILKMKEPCSIELKNGGKMRSSENFSVNLLNIH